jgi:type I restriction enzyme S subunit
MIPPGWTTAPLGELAEVCHDVHDPAQFGDQQVDLFSIPAFDQYRGPQRISAATIKSAKLLLAEPCVLVSRLNPHIPRTWRVIPDPAVPALASPELTALRAVSCSNDYLYAACQTKEFQRELATRVTGTSTSHQRVKRQDLLSIPIPLPPHDAQEHIATVVAALERRRAISERMAALTDALLRELFRRRFPEVFNGDAELGGFVDLTTGVSYRSSELGGEGQALVTLKSFGRDGTYQESGLKAWSGEPKASQRLDEGDVVVAHTDLTQAAEVLGRAVVVRRSSRYKRLVASLDMAVIRPRLPLTRAFVLGMTRQPEFRQYCRSHANGTTVLHLSRRAVPAFRFTIPAKEAVAAYSNDVQPLLGRQLLADDERLALQRLQEVALAEFFGEVVNI